MQRLVYFTVHFLFWTTFLTLSWMSLSINPMEQEFMKANPASGAILVAWAVFHFYTFYLYIQPLYLDAKKYLTYFMVSVAFSITVTAVFVGIFYWLFPDFRDYALQKYVEGTVGSFLISQCGSLLRGFVSWNKNLQNKTALENQSLRNELAMLKAQLSPHFLFNTLNNIDSLIHKSQDEASAMLIKLSSLLRYMLYESEIKEVSITREISYIQQLVELQQVRFAQTNFIRLEIHNDAPDFKIAPLIFLPFIENAFKFVSKPTTMPAISISVNVYTTGVHLHCQNAYSPSPNVQNEGGIGLANARRRLELLYPDRFVLKISSANSIFTVDLTITAS